MCDFEGDGETDRASDHSGYCFKGIYFEDCDDRLVLRNEELILRFSRLLRLYLNFSVSNIFSENFCLS
jgi:hypothetical protein